LYYSSLGLVEWYSIDDNCFHPQKVAFISVVALRVGATHVEMAQPSLDLQNIDTFLRVCSMLQGTDITGWFSNLDPSLERTFARHYL